MLKSRPAPASRPTVAHSAGGWITLAPLACPYCHHGLRAHDVEPLGNCEARIVCPECGRDLLLIEG